MTLCNCLKTDGKQCTRDASTKKGDNPLFCWQHQKCKTTISMITSHEPEPLKKKRITEETIKKPEPKEPVKKKQVGEETIRKPKLEEHVKVLSGVETYLLFLTDKIKTGSNKTYDEILLYDDSEMESDHQFIQWLFPLPEPSAFASNVPVIDILELIGAIKLHPYIKEKFGKSYSLILSHWGMKSIGYVPGPAKDESNAVFKSKIVLLNGHDGLRFSRVLQSMVYHGLKDQAIDTLKYILKYTQKVDGEEPLLHPSMHESGITLWEFYLSKAITNYKQIINKVRKDPHDYMSKVVGDIGEIGKIFKEMPLQPIAVVNAANANLATGSGVTGALVKSVGGSAKWNHLVSQAKTIDDQPVKLPLKVGNAAYTSVDGQLKLDKISYIIHGLGPVAGSDDISLIKATIYNILKLADHLTIKTIILPAISGGIFALGDPTWATKIRQLIIDEIKNYINNQPTKIQKIYLISYDNKDQALWPNL